MANKGVFTPKNPQKYLAANIREITYRSSWELSAMMFFDNAPSILGWSSESIPTKTMHESGIAYLNPFTGRQSIYVPDFFVIYVDKNGKRHAEVIEIKPSDEVPPAMGGVRGRLTEQKEARRMLNLAKFTAAIEHCARRGWQFRVMTEKEMFRRRKAK
jgi:hypothetical protein